MPDGGAVSHAPPSHALELEQETHDILLYEFFLAAGVDTFSTLFPVHVGFLQNVLFSILRFFAVALPVLDLSE